MAFKLRGQAIDMFPLKGRFVESGILGDVVGDEIEFLSLQNGKCLGLDLMEGYMRCNIGCREQFEDLASLLQVLVALVAVLIHLVLCGLFRAIGLLSDVRKQAVDQMVMESLIAVVDKTEQIDTDGPLLQLLQPEDRVIRHQRGIVFDTFIGNLQCWQKRVGQGIQVIYLSTTLDFAFDFTGTEISGLSLELCDGVEARGILQETMSVLDVRRPQILGGDGGQPLLFMRQRLADRANPAMTSFTPVHH